MCNCSALSIQHDNDSYHENEQCTYDISPKQLEVCCLITQHLEVEGRIMVCLSGLLFNTYAVFLFFDKKLLSELFNRLLLCLVLMDNVYLLIGVFEIWFYNLNVRSFANFETYFFFIYPFRGIMLCCTIYMTVTLAFERYKSIALPIDNAMRNQMIYGVTWTNVMKFVVPVVLFSIIFKFPLFFEVVPEHYVSGEDSSLGGTSIGTMKEWYNGTHNISSTLVVSNMRKNHLYVSFYMNIANLVVTGIFPVIVLIYFNLRVIKEMRSFAERRSTRRRSSVNMSERQKAKEKKNKRTQTFILYAVVVNFFICHILRIVLNIEDMVIHYTTFEDLNIKCQYGHPLWYFISLPISEILLKFNSSVNFFIYCVFNRNFRGIIKNHISYICNLCSSLKCGRNLGGHSNLSQINTETTAQSKTKIHSPHSPHYFPTVTKEETFTEMRLVPMDTRLSKTSCNSITVLRDNQ